MATRTSKKASPSGARERRARKASATVAPRAAATAVELRLERLRELVRILEGSTLAGLRYEDEELAVELTRVVAGSQGAVSAPGPQVAAAPAAPAKAPDAPKGAPDAEERDLHVVRSPFVGTFYATPSPEAEPFTAVGKRVRRGQTLCIVEAMKLMNEIESEVDGVVLEIIAENGKPVQYGDALFKLQKAS